MTADVATLQTISDTLQNNPKASQRELANDAGMSVGLMNAVLKRFVERGWIMLTNVNGRKLAYALTPEGLSELAERGKKFAIRTFKLANDYSKTIANAIAKARELGKTKVVLYGKSYIKFLVEYACTMESMEFEYHALQGEFVSSIKDDILLLPSDSFCLAGELNSREMQDYLFKAGCVSLVDLVRGE